MKPFIDETVRPLTLPLHLFFMALSLFLIGILTYTSLPLHAQNKSNQTEKTTTKQSDSLKSMDEQSMRMVSGREGLTFDTMTVNGELEEQIATDQNQNDFGLLIGPIIFNEIVVGQSKMVSPAAPDSRFNDKDESFTVDVGPVRGGFMSEMSLGFIGGPSTGMGGFGAGGMKMNGIRVDVNKQ